MSRSIILSLALCMGAASSASIGNEASARPQLNDTGATKCVHPFGNYPVPCAGTGQDGEFGRDATQNHPRNGAAGFAFVKVCHSGEWAGNGSCPSDAVLGSGHDDWACTLDKVTGRMWEIKTTSGIRSMDVVFSNGYPDPPGPDIARLIAELNGIGLCGGTDWVLPNATDLQSIVNYGRAAPGPAIDSTFFPNTIPGSHWTSSLAGGGTQAFSVDFYAGDETISHRELSMPARLVRSGGFPPGNRFDVSADGQRVTDRWTGLVWQRCALGQTWDGSTCAGTSNTWGSETTLSLINGMGNGWRLPNVKELRALLPELFSEPDAFPGTPSCRFWSSTPARGTDDTWYVEFGWGFVHPAERSEGFCARAVRGRD